MSQNRCDGREQAKGIPGFRVQQPRPHGMKLPLPSTQMNSSSKMGLQPVQQTRPHGMKIPPPPAQVNSSSRMSQGKWKNSPRPQRRNQSQTSWASTEHMRNQNNWASPEPRMQAIFLGSGPKSSGTGVFIPQTHVVVRQFNKRPAFSPVLLPTRVVRVLNLNVHHENGQSIKPQSGQGKNAAKKDEQKLEKNKKKENGIYISPDIFLPEEWTY
ncbi:Unknown protein [Striga hermonthica]|uniref:Uncharacterized protein n=1 Tax=Striga hermonthica TaxID=68872 RepID=A0A9N7NMU8_STRHE|nr:Unknown protein [Striga hermonthica]